MEGPVKKRKRLKHIPVTYKEPRRAPGYKYLDNRNPAEDNEKDQMEQLIKFVYDNRPSF
jgi:hypothetical protein